MLDWINTLTVPFKLQPAALAFPNIFVINLIAMFRRNLNTPVPEMARAFHSPGFEFFAVRVGFDVADHEVGEMAEFVGDDIQEARFVVDNFLGEFDGGMVSVGNFSYALGVVGLYGFAFPVCSACRGVEFFTPDDFNASSRGRQFGDLALSENFVKFNKEGFSKIMLLV